MYDSGASVVPLNVESSYVGGRSRSLVTSFSLYTYVWIEDYDLDSSECRVHGFDCKV